MVVVALLIVAAALIGAGALKLLVPASAPTIASRIASRGPAAALAVGTLPFLEIGLGGMLAVPATRRPAAVACVVLIAVFSTVLAVARKRGDATPCGCFGPSDNAAHPLQVLLRNGGLLVLAATVALSDTHGIDALTMALASAAIASTGVALILSNELRLLAHRALQSASATALDVAMTNTAGEVISIRRWLKKGGSHLLVFVDPICGPCRTLLPELRQYQQAGNRIAVISRGPMDENVALAREFDLAPIAVQQREAVSVRFGITATPTAVLLSSSGDVTSGPALGRAAILALLTGVATSTASVNGAAGASL